MQSLFPELTPSINQRLFIGVIGEGKCSSPQVSEQAYEVGFELGKSGAILICGGLGGVMEYAAKGAKAAGGLTIGILPGYARKSANPFIDIPIVTSLNEARNLIIVRSSDAIIAIAGGYGTLSEIGFALALKVPIIGLNTWTLQKGSQKHKAIIEAATAKDAVVMALKAAKSQRAIL